jgi:hypothetical protein
MRSVAVSIGPGEGVEKPETRTKTDDWIPIALWGAKGSDGGRTGRSEGASTVRRLVPGPVPSFAVSLPTAPWGPWAAMSAQLVAGERVRQSFEQLAARLLVGARSYLPTGVCALEVRQLLEEDGAGDLCVA